MKPRIAAALLAAFFLSACQATVHQCGPVAEINERMVEDHVPSLAMLNPITGSVETVWATPDGEIVSVFTDSKGKSCIGSARNIEREVQPAPEIKKETAVAT